MGLPLIFGIIIGAFFVIFALQNSLAVTVSIFAWHFTAPAALVVAGALALGAIATLLGLIPSFIKNERYIKQLEQEKRAAETELSKYRITIPLAPPIHSESDGIPVYVRSMPNQ